MSIEFVLSETELRRALHLGQGRAYLNIRDQGIEKVKALVLNACLSNQVLDPQCEPGRAEWLFSIFWDTSVYAEFSREICTALLTSTIPDWTWTLSQLCKLAKIMAEHGDNKAREALHIRALQQAFDPIDDTTGVEEWIELEGLRGYIEIARCYGKRLLDDISDEPGIWSFFEWYKDALEKGAKSDIALNAYWSYLINKEEKRIRSRLRESYRDKIRRHFPVELVLSDSQLRRKELAPYVQFGRFAEPHEIEKIVLRLSLESNEDFCFKLLWLLRCSDVPIPYWNDRIFRWAVEGKDKFRAAAFIILGRLRDDRVRELVNQKLLRRELLGPENWNTLLLFFNNYEPGDARTISEAIYDLPTEHEDIECLGSDLLKIGERHLDPNLDQAMMWIYENTPSTNHRYRAFRFLCTHGKAKQEVLQESCYDAHPDTRKLANDQSSVIKEKTSQDKN